MITGYFRCNGCGALTVICDNGGEYSVSNKNRRKYLPGLDLRTITRYNPVVCCNHCVNHFGMDLCACGSGMAPDKCDNHLDCCGKPSQVLEGRTCYRAADAIGL